MWFVYILLCVDNSLYTGITNNLEKRFLAHQSGKGSKYTRSHKPLRILYQEKLPGKSEALKREKQIKKLGREDKINILNLLLDG